ncbi:sulfite exporter TauE/SafE family protein [Verrucomicrobia bacterium LW23]|nr:sulfite exporter TauE/SafE family protein [Verrucomicrobia bacterium LW23]
MPHVLSSHFSLGDLSVLQWVMVLVGALCVGLAKGGLAGLGLVTVVLMAQVLEPMASTGVVLPLLIVGDLFAVNAYHRHAQWAYIRNLMIPSALGVVLGWLLMGAVSKPLFGAVIGWVVLAMVAFQVWRSMQGDWLNAFFQRRRFAWGMGLLGGTTTMLANAAGPVMSVFFLAVKLPKMELIGTSAWFFCLLNLFKVPFSAGMGLLHSGSLSLALVMAPVVIGGVYLGKWTVVRIPQKWFDPFLLACAALAAIHLIWTSLPKAGV